MIDKDIRVGDVIEVKFHAESSIRWRLAIVEGLYKRSFEAQLPDLLGSSPLKPDYLVLSYSDSGNTWRRRNAHTSTAP